MGIYVVSKSRNIKVGIINKQIISYQEQQGKFGKFGKSSETG